MRELVNYVATQITECRKFVDLARDKADLITLAHYQGRIDAYERVLGEIKTVIRKTGYRIRDSGME